MSIALHLIFKKERKLSLGLGQQNQFKQNIRDMGHGRTKLNLVSYVSKISDTSLLVLIC